MHYASQILQRFAFCLLTVVFAQLSFAQAAAAQNANPYVTYC